MESGIDLLHGGNLVQVEEQGVYIYLLLRRTYLRKQALVTRSKQQNMDLQTEYAQKRKLIFVMFDYLFARYLHQQLHHIRYVFIVFKNK